MPHIILKFKN